MKTEISKNDLLCKLQDNLDQHREMFEEAIEGYRKKAIEVLNERIDAIKKSPYDHCHVMLTMPSDHSDDYKRVILMVEADVREVIELSEQEFAQYFMDDWGWMTAFNDTYTAYTVGV